MWTTFEKSSRKFLRKWLLIRVSWARVQVNQLRLATDSGSEFKVKGGSFGDRLYAKLSAAGLMNDRSMLIHSYNLASAPSQAAYVERMNSTIRQKLRLAVQAEQGTIQRSKAMKVKCANEFHVNNIDANHSLH
eukprot:COSAG06_NODE_433_length_15843_cov_10.266768_2_plen_133_part_00